MRPERWPQRSARFSFAIAIALALAACAGGGTGASPQPTATASPSPTPEPVDIAAEFAAQVRESPSFVAELSGTLLVGELEGDVTGELEIAGQDMHSLTTVTFPGLPEQETETITVDGVTYERTDLAYWLRRPAGEGGGGARPPDPVTAALANADDLEVVGTETHAGEMLHRIESTSPAAAVTPESLGLNDPSITEFEAEVAFLAEDDGTPAGILLVAAWMQGTQDQPVPAEMDLRFMFTQREAEIVAPDDRWVRHQSAEYGYQMDYPASWDYAHEPATGEFSAYDYFVGPIDGQVQVYPFTETDIAGLLPNEWFRQSAELLEERLTSAPELTNVVSLGQGLEGQIYIGELTEGGETYFFQEAVIFGGDIAWDVDWYSDPGNESEDQQLFLTIVMSFERYAP